MFEIQHVVNPFDQLPEKTDRVLGVALLEEHCLLRH